MTRKYFQADDGARLPVHVHGQGPALVLLHGWTGHFQDWRPIVERLQAHFTCYGWEARPYHADEPTVERMGRDVRNLFDAFGLERPLLLGHSMGAMICWEYLRQFGDDRLAGLCLVDQSPRFYTDADWSLGLWGQYTPVDNERFRQALEADFPEAVLDLIARNRVGGIPRPLLEGRRQRLQRMVAESWIRAWQSFVIKDYRDVLEGIRVPTFLAYGGLSAYYGPKVAAYVNERIPGSELVLYPDAGHSPQVEAMEAFIADLLAFARRHQLLD